MEIKKNKKANLDNKRKTFIQIGLVFGLSLVLTAFEWKTPINEPVLLGDNFGNPTEIELPPITLRKEIEKPKPKPKPVELEIIDDKKEVEEEFKMDDVEPENNEPVLIDFVPEPDPEPVVDDVPYVLCEDKPEFPGGQKALLRYLAQIDYPEIAKIEGMQGKVYVGFTIEKDGSITDVRVLREVDPYLDAAAEAQVRNMPKWKPGKQRGIPVRVPYQVPINFILR